MNKELFKEIENIINSNKNYKEHYHLCTYFEVEHIDILLKEYKKSKSENTNLKQALNEIREYANNPFNWKYTDHYLEKDDILQIIDKVLGDDINENN